MNMFNRFSQRCTLCGCALLLCFSLAAGADEIQEVNKLFKQGKQEQALGRINSYLASKPKDAQARFLKGLILTEQDKTNDAIKVFSDLTEDFPELPEPYNNLAVLYASQGQYDKARIALEMAIRTHPSYATAHENLGDIYAKMASQAYDRALQLDHSNPSTQTKLAMVKEIFATGATKTGKPGKTTHKGQTTGSAPIVENVAPTVSATTTTAPSSATTSVAAVPASMVASATPSPVAPIAVTALEPAAVPSKQPIVHKSSLPNNSNDVLNRVHAWAAAWSSRNVKNYLAFYAGDFNVPGKISRSKWEALRNERIVRQKSIKVTISNAKVQFTDDSHASVSFNQGYHASHLHTSSSKTLILEKSGNNWLIQDESTGN